MRDVLAGARVEDMDREAVTLAIAFGLIERREQTKPCPTCGTAKFDFGYWRVTAAGRLMAQALADDTPPETGTGTEGGR